MNAVRESFRDRCREVDEYFRLLELIDAEGCALIRRVDGRKRKVAIRQEWVKTLKATSFLLLYNLIEATVRDVITSLYDKIASEALSTSDATRELIEVWVEQEFRLLDKYSASPRSYHELVSRLVHAINAGDLLRIPSDDLPISGNLDAAIISKLCSKHGIRLVIPKLARGGAELSNIKRRRNDLAHGVLSFEECGRQITVVELDSMRRESISYLRSLLAHVSKFAAAKKYRRVS